MDDREEPRITDPTYQDRDLRLSVVMGVVVVSLLVTAFTFFAMARMISAYRARQAAQERSISPLAAERMLPARTLLQVNEAKDLATFRASEEAVLQQFAWIDRQAGSVRIPVDVAMERVAQKGLPVAPEFKQAPAAKQEP